MIPIGIGGAKHALVGGFVGVDGHKYPIKRIIVGVGNANHLAWSTPDPIIPANKYIYSGAIYCGQDFYF